MHMLAMVYVTMTSQKIDPDLRIVVLCYKV